MSVILGDRLMRLIGCCLFGDTEAQVEVDTTGLYMYRTDTLEYASSSGTLTKAEYAYILRIANWYESECSSNQKNQCDGKQ